MRPWDRAGRRRRRPRRRPIRFLSYEDLRDRGIKWGRNWIREQEKRGKFPRRVQWGPNARDGGWVEEEIDDYQESLIDARDCPTPEAQAVEEARSKQTREAARKRHRARAAQQTIDQPSEAI